MYRILMFLSLIISAGLTAQNRAAYLAENRFDLSVPTFDFPQKDFKIIGFGAYHGSAKTEAAEHKLINALTKAGAIKYYLPETDFSIAHFFNKYLETGDTILLKDLVIHYGRRVPQERTIEIYEKWKNLKALNDELPTADKLKVIGIDFQVDYKYATKHILELIDNTGGFSKPLTDLQTMVELDTTDFALGDGSYAYRLLKDFVTDFESRAKSYYENSQQHTQLNHIIRNLKITFQSVARNREKIIYDNYLALDALYNFKANPQLLRFGFFHLEKAREGKASNPSFFAMLIENGVYAKSEVISIIGYLTESRVLWNEQYDEAGTYTGFTTEGGYGIGDYWKEYFSGIKHLKKSRVADLTLFRLNQPNSPYQQQSQLMEIKLFLKQSNRRQLKGMNTLDFIDYAVLITHSEASRPIYELN